MTFNRPGVLLGEAGYFGTLAAVRDLGRMGVEVAVGEYDGRPTHSGASRFCTRRLPAPSLYSGQYLQWLLTQSEDMPGACLYATSDDMAWLMATHRDELSQRFSLFQPPFEAVCALLDKSQLYAHAQRLGIPVPATHAPTSLEDITALSQVLARDGGYPVIVKPRTQACMAIKLKGTVVRSPDALLQAVVSLVAVGAEQAQKQAELVPDLEWPLIQSFLPDAQHNTYSLSGFVDRHGVVRAARASVKAFQFPVKVGVGVAFEGRPVRADLVAHVQALARATGYFGVFEVEFIHVKASDSYLLMDFNPRYYGQMQFEVSRGMHLPRMVYAAATGDEAQLDALCDEAHRSCLTDDADRQRYCNRWLFGVLLRTQRLGGRLSAPKHAAWLRWMTGPDVFDFVQDADDHAPQRGQQAALLRHWLRHPRSSMRDLFQ